LPSAGDTARACEGESCRDADTTDNATYHPSHVLGAVAAVRASVDGGVDDDTDVAATPSACARMSHTIYPSRVPAVAAVRGSVTGGTGAGTDAPEVVAAVRAL
jgi:hypothetical protein